MKPPFLNLGFVIVLGFLHTQLQAQTGGILEQSAMKALQRGNSADRYHQAVCFDEAANLFDKASLAYESEDKKEKSGFMSEMAASARHRAKEIRQSIRQESFLAIGSLTGSEYKIFRKSPSSKREDKKRTDLRFFFQGGFSNPDRPGSAVYGVGTTEIILEAVFDDPMIYLALSEQFVGEFLFGNLSGPLEPNHISLSGSGQFGFGADLSVIHALYIGIEYTYRKHDLNAELPVFVIPWLGGDPYQTSGSLNSEVIFHSAGLNVSYSFFRGPLRPFGGSSIHCNWQDQGSTTVKIGDVVFPIDYPTEKLVFTSWSAQAGLIAKVNNWISTRLEIRKTWPLSLSDRTMLGNTFGGVTIFLTL